MNDIDPLHKAKTAEVVLRTELDYRGARNLRIEARPSAVKEDGFYVLLMDRITGRRVEISSEDADKLLEQLPPRVSTITVLQVARHMESAVLS